MMLKPGVLVVYGWCLWRCMIIFSVIGVLDTAGRGLLQDFEVRILYLIFY